MTHVPDHGGRRLWRRRLIGAGLLLAAAVVSAVWFWQSFHTRWDENRRLPLAEPLRQSAPAPTPPAARP